MLDFSLSVAQPVVSVSELNRLARDLLEAKLPLMWVRGEISNLKRYDSGHCYFTLKDAQAQVDCVIFRHKLQYFDWRPDDGMQVEVRACPTLYEARGKFQLNVETMRRSGLGALFEAFARLKARLEKEGLFDPAHRKPLPPFPRTLGVVTSLQAAALRDVLTTLRRRMPSLPLIVYPVPVQGDGAGRRIAAAIALAAARAECDVLIVCRGGGSIADFVADVRGPTPTAAAEMATPDGIELKHKLQHWHRRLGRAGLRSLEERMQRLDYLGKSLIHPGKQIRERMATLRHLSSQMRGAWRRASQEEVWRIRELAGRLSAACCPDTEALQRENGERARRLRHAAARRLDAAASLLTRTESHLKHLNPQLVLERGYSITATGTGKIVRDSAEIACGEELKITFAKGSAGAQVKHKFGAENS